MTPGHINQLPYVKAVLRESLRPYPPSAGFPVAIQGNADEPFFLQGKYALKRNEAMFVLMPPLHRDASAYGDDVNEFRPERMLEENFNKLPPGCFKVSSVFLRHVTNLTEHFRPSDQGCVPVLVSLAVLYPQQ